MKAIGKTPVKHSTNGTAPKAKTAGHRPPARKHAAAPAPVEQVVVEEPVVAREPATVEEAGVAAEAVTMTADAVASVSPASAAQTLPATPPSEGEGTTDPEGDDEAQAPVVKQKQRVDYYRMVALVRRQIDSVRALDPLLAALLAERGVTTAYLTSLESQLEATLMALETRQAKMKAAQDAGVAVERAKFIVQDALGTLRIVGRTVAAEGIEGDLTQLHLNDPLPRAMDLLILQARAAFEGAQAEPYASLLATAAYPPEAVEAALTAITVLEQLDLARGLAQKEAMQATENRDRAMRDLRRAVRPLRAQMRAVLRRHPEFVTPLGF